MHWPLTWHYIFLQSINAYQTIHIIKMEDIGDFVVLKQLVTSFCPQVLKYMCVHIYNYCTYPFFIYLNFSKRNLSNQRGLEEKVHLAIDGAA